MSPVSSSLVLVTGGSGFVASHCILALHRAGYRVRATLRSLSRVAALEEMLRQAEGGAVPVQWFAADLEEVGAWPAAMAGVDFVLHVASPFPRVAPKTPAEVIDPARRGVIHVLRAAAAAGVKRVVMTSSTAAITYGFGNRAQPFRAEDWSDPESPDNSTYTRSKTYAERAAWDFLATDRSGLELVTINPGLVLGPVLEKDYGTSAEIVLKLLRGDFPGMPRIGFPLVDVRDVAELHVRALTHPEAASRRFLCVNEFMWMEDIAAILREHRPDRAKKMPRRRLPDWLVRAGALFDPVTRSVIFELGIRRECDARETAETFGINFRSNREAIIATADTLRAQRLV